eukprot:TRINITY_DN11552_c0_g1_i1.p1 TRINITY_DN11552_c0_g1~~TRINITY_DN11552_c0_g1_i1.p1  ORF type:complete len:112 (-),score=15.41 TRINITY_DN11552_c0_g1_i1:86-421(-)
MADLFAKSSQGFVFNFAINSRETFNGIVSSRGLIESIKGYSDFPSVLCGNKCDLEDDRQISVAEAEELAKKFGCRYFETSAKDDIGVKEPFEYVVRVIHQTLDIPTSQTRK